MTVVINGTWETCICAEIIAHRGTASGRSGATMSSLLKSSRSAMFPATRATPHLARQSHACQKRGIVCKTEASSANIVRPLHVVKVARDCCRLSKRRRTSTSHRVGRTDDERFHGNVAAYAQHMSLARTSIEARKKRNSIKTAASKKMSTSGKFPDKTDDLNTERQRRGDIVITAPFHGPPGHS